MRSIRESIQLELYNIFNSYGQTTKRHLSYAEAKVFLGDLFEVFGDQYPERQLNELCYRLDRNRDGFISKEDLEAVIFSGAPFIEKVLQEREKRIVIEKF